MAAQDDSLLPLVTCSRTASFVARHEAFVEMREKHDKVRPSLRSCHLDLPPPMDPKAVQGCLPVAANTANPCPVAPRVTRRGVHCHTRVAQISATSRSKRPCSPAASRYTACRATQLTSVRRVVDAEPRRGRSALDVLHARPLARPLGVRPLPRLDAAAGFELSAKACRRIDPGRLTVGPARAALAGFRPSLARARQDHGSHAGGSRSSEYHGNDGCVKADRGSDARPQYWSHLPYENVASSATHDALVDILDECASRLNRFIDVGSSHHSSLPEGGEHGVEDSLERLTKWMVRLAPLPALRCWRALTMAIHLQNAQSALLEVRRSLVLLR